VTEIALQNRLGIFLVLSHFAILLMVILFWLLEAFLTEEMTTTVAIIAPFFAAYTTAIIRHVIKTRNQVGARGRRVTGVFAFLAFLTPVLFVVVVTTAVVLKAFNIGLTSFQNFKPAFPG
jgi:dolichol kinase